MAKQLRAFILAVIAVGIIGVMLFLFYPNWSLLKDSTEHVEKIVSATSRAIVVQDDGSQMFIDQATHQELLDKEGQAYAMVENGKIRLYVRQANALATIYDTIKTPKGGFFDVEFPDGTQLTLNPGSTLAYTLPFDLDERRVRVDGEAYFDVAPDTARAFVVEIPRGEIHSEKAGGKLNVRNYRTDSTVRIISIDRLVTINLIAKDSLLTLQPGEQLVSLGSVLQVNQVSVEDAIAWRNGWIVFNMMPMEEILKRLGRWYNVEVGGDSIPDISISGRIKANAPFNEFLAIIGAAGNLEFALHDRRLEVKR